MPDAKSYAPLPVGPDHVTCIELKPDIFVPDSVTPACTQDAEPDAQGNKRTSAPVFAAPDIVIAGAEHDPVVVPHEPLDWQV